MPLKFTLLAALQAAVPPQLAPAELLPLTHISAGRLHAITLTLDESPFAQLWLNGRTPYVWPLHGPTGEEMTRAFPMETGRPNEAEDHPHHRSFWFTHGSVDGLDYWHDPDCLIQPDGKVEVASRSGILGTEITLPLVWSAPDRPVVLKEKRTLRFAAANDVRLVELESTLTAPSAEVDPDGVLFGDTKEGSFALRLRPELRMKGAVAAGTIVNSVGQTGGDCWGQRAQWVSYDAPLGGAGGRVSVTVMDHTKNLRHPTWWHARDYGLVAANPFGAHGLGGEEDRAGEYRLAPGESLTQRYLVVLAQGEGDRALSAAEVDALYRWWVLSRGRPPELPDQSR